MKNLLILFLFFLVGCCRCPVEEKKVENQRESYENFSFSKKDLPEIEKCKELIEFYYGKKRMGNFFYVGKSSKLFHIWKGEKVLREIGEKVRNLNKDIKIDPRALYFKIFHFDFIGLTQKQIIETFGESEDCDVMGVCDTFARYKVNCPVNLYFVERYSRGIFIVFLFDSNYKVAEVYFYKFAAM